MNLRGWKFEPVAWMTGTLAVLTTVETVNEAAHLLPSSWTPYLLGAIAVLTGVLGKLARDKVTPTAAPKTDDGTRLVPVWATRDEPLAK